MSWNKQRRLNRKLKKILFDPEKNNYCAICSKKLSYISATIDHIIQRSFGGTNDLSNIILTCKKCNNERGDLSFNEYKLSLGY